MPQTIAHRTAQVPNAPYRVAGLTIPQLLAMTAAFVLGAAAWWELGALPLAGMGFFFARSIGCGLLAGLLGLLAYATFDARREPFVRQAVTYPFRRHLYRRQETPHGPTVVAFPTRARTRATHTTAVRPARAPRRIAAWIARLRRAPHA